MDNGTCFTSKEFVWYSSSNFSAIPPSFFWICGKYHPNHEASVEEVTLGTLTICVPKVLFTHELAPQGTTGVSPPELLLGWRPRSKLALMGPNTAVCLQHRHLQQKTHHDVRLDAHKLQEGEEVYLRNFGKGEMWLPG